MILSLFKDQELKFIVYYIIVFFLLFSVFNINFITEEICIFICFFSILNLLSISLIKFVKQSLTLNWQKTVLWFFTKFTFLFLIAFVTNITTTLKNFFNFYFINFLNFLLIDNNYMQVISNLNKQVSLHKLTLKQRPLMVI